MLVTLVVLQSFSLLFLMASYSVHNKMLALRIRELQQNSVQPWPDREN